MREISAFALVGTTVGAAIESNDIILTNLMTSHCFNPITCAGAVCFIEDSSGPQNLWVSIVLKASNMRVQKVMSQRSTNL